jgi:hypothetical protein
MDAASEASPPDMTTRCPQLAEKGCPGTLRGVALFKRRGGPQVADIYLNLRQRILDIRPAEVGLHPSDRLPDVWGFVMDTGYQAGPWTLAALADGTTSLYLGTGGGTIGAGEHEQVAAATLALLGAVQLVHREMPFVDGHGLPGTGRVTMRVLTYEGQRAVEADEQDLGQNRHRFSELFHAAHVVIAEVRMAEERRTGR